ncbi:mechanosensitive ion channel [Zavarzinia compransoris]|uniref:mechanosensitive ion channel family protein n=1 Tax=Zavarzinia marina TaxID=2911065 RepID=UPI001F292412|nr:mechanosensitive ion channel domain-containing protein [Zavarzinia marina]MCF4166902.1 mechanosensitive ion channel [Zavarzinia marina]
MDFKQLMADSPVLVTWIIDQGLNLLVALLIIVIGWTVAGWLSRTLRKVLGSSSRVEPTLVPVIATLARYLVLVFVLIAVLDRFGVQTASLLAMLGAAGLAIGLALQGTLSNVAAGFMLLLLRPFKLGDFVEVSDHAGTVREIGLFATVLVSFDGIWRQIPNSTVWSSAVINYSRESTRMINVTMGIDYDDDVDLAMSIIGDVMAAESRILAEPAPIVAVGELGASSVDILVRGWVRREDFWATRWDLLKELKIKLGAAGITIPFPQTVISLRDGTMPIPADAAE